MFTGAGTLALGHNHPAVIQSIQDTLASGLPLHTLDLTTPLKDAFTEALLAYLPGGKEEYCLQFCGPSGADATEAAIKLAKTFTGQFGDQLLWWLSRYDSRFFGDDR